MLPLYVRVILAMNRALDCSSALSVNSLVFSGGETWSEDEPNTRVSANLQSLAQSVPGPSSNDTDESRRSGKEQDISTYVRIFEGALKFLLGSVD